MGNAILGLVFGGLGAYVVYDIKKNGVTTRRAKIIAGIFGDRFAKGFYTVLGYLLIAMGIGLVITHFVGVPEGT